MKDIIGMASSSMLLMNRSGVVALESIIVFVVSTMLVEIL